MPVGRGAAPPFLGVAMITIEELLTLLVQRKGSDLHISAGSKQNGPDEAARRVSELGSLYPYRHVTPLHPCTMALGGFLGGSSCRSRLSLVDREQQQQADDQKHDDRKEGDPMPILLCQERRLALCCKSLSCPRRQ